MRQLADSRAHTGSIDHQHRRHGHDLVKWPEYRAPLHGILTDPDSNRYSAPFLLQSPHGTLVAPMENQQNKAVYEPYLWGYFQAVRFAGDLTDHGVEIQIGDYEKKKNLYHLAKQA